MSRDAVGCLPRLQATPKSGLESVHRGGVPLGRSLHDFWHWADVCVFALLDHTDQATIDPLDVAKWRAFVLPTRGLDERTRSQYSITLKSLVALAGDGLDFDGLRPAVLAAAGRERIS